MKTVEIIYAGLFAAITAIVAQISIPLSFTPVPITFQILSVCMAGAILGSKLGGLSILIYDLIGIIGIPVFSGFEGGFSIVVGPKGGYIIAFPIAAFLIGYIVEHSSVNKKFTSFIAMLIGLALIYIIGMVQLAIVTKMGLLKAFYAGVMPFIPLDLVKIVVAAIITEPIKKAINLSQY